MSEVVLDFAALLNNGREHTDLAKSFVFRGRFADDGSRIEGSNLRIKNTEILVESVYSF